MKTTAEKIAVMQAHLDGKPIECFGMGERWFLIDYPLFNWEENDYRIAVTKPSINPDHVSHKFKWMATDADGSTWLYRDKPSYGSDAWAPRGTLVADAHDFASFVPGTCDWQDSLVKIRD